MPSISPGATVGGKYKVEAEIGRGGMGIVLRAKRLSDRWTVAVKVCTVRGRDDLKKRLNRELRIMQRMEHPNVISVLDADLTHDPPYIVMPLAQGSLKGELATFTSDEEAALDAFKQVCIGVQAIHGEGVFHRDLKPANCLRMQDGRVVVSDMGLARMEVRDTTVLTATDENPGTRAFMAPEQFELGGTRDADARTDVYQLGKTLYNMLTGQLPLSMNLVLLPTGLRHIVTRATKDLPEDRYQTVTDLITAVDTFRRSQDPEADPHAASQPRQGCVASA
jgi:serine/threonine protein kinase